MAKKIKAIRTFLVLALAAMLVGGAAYAAAKKIIYFTIGPKPTVGEAAQIAQIKAITAQPFSLKILNSKNVKNAKVTGDYVAGSAIPHYYRDGGIDSGELLIPEMTPSNPPAPNTLPSNQAMVYNGQVVTIAGGGSYTLNVSSSTLTSITYVAPDGGT